MGPYELERDSFYVNGYNEAHLQPAVPPTPIANNFTVNITVTNLRYRPQMRDRSSEVFASAAKVLSTLFGRVAVATSIGPTFSGCEVTSLKSMRNGDTGMDALCSYRNNSDGPIFDRVTLYREVVNKTTGFTEMGPYTLDRNSLYINGYNEAVLPRTVDNFTVNFTIINLRHRPQMENHGSDIFHSTAVVVTTLLGGILNSTMSIGPAYLGCNVTMLRPVGKRGDTGVDSVCTYRNVSQLEKTKLYHEIINRTNVFTKMGPYRLSQNSLFVNGYHEAIHPTEGNFTVNFTVTNLRYRSEMGNPQSRVFSLSRNTVAGMLDHISEKSSIGPLLTGCSVSNLRSIDERKKTGVDGVCNYQKDPTMPTFDRVRVYHEFINTTDGFTKIGPYTLDRESLFVDGYHEPPIEQQGFIPLSNRPAGIEQFTTNFSVINLRYRPAMSDPRSTIFDSTQQVFTTLMGRTFKTSSIGPAFMRCNVTTLRSLSAGTGTGVDSVCAYRREATAPSFDRLAVYHEVVNKTQGFTKLGPYELDKTSLFVNGKLWVIAP
nr:mucin-16-like [Pogona vitticeps]